METALAFLADYLAVIMFVTMFIVIFCGYPVAFVLGGAGLIFGLIGWSLGTFRLESLQSILLRMWGGVATDPVLVSSLVKALKDAGDGKSVLFLVRRGDNTIFLAVKPPSE